MQQRIVHLLKLHFFPLCDEIKSNRTKHGGFILSTSMFPFAFKATVSSCKDTVCITHPSIADGRVTDVKAVKS